MKTLFNLSFLISCCLNLYFFLNMESKAKKYHPITTRTPISIPRGHRYIELPIPKEQVSSRLDDYQVVDIVIKSVEPPMTTLMQHKKIVKVLKKPHHWVLGTFLNLQELNSYVKLPARLHYSILPKNPADGTSPFSNQKWKILEEGSER